MNNGKIHPILSGLHLERCMTSSQKTSFTTLLKFVLNEYYTVAKKSYDRKCDHHWFFIKYVDEIIGWVILACKNSHPNTNGDLILHSMHIREQYARLGYGRDVLNILRTKYFWNKSIIEIDERAYDICPEFYNKYGCVRSDQSYIMYL